MFKSVVFVVGGLFLVAVLGLLFAGCETGTTGGGGTGDGGPCRAPLVPQAPGPSGNTRSADHPN